MNNQRIILIIGAIVVVMGVVGAFFLYQRAQNPPLFRTQDSLSKSENNLSNDEKCVITVRGDKYDVTEFRNRHKGGNIFNCGEDMTETFNKQHGEKQLREMQRYKVN